MSCPTCGKPTEPKFRPFCSKRCQDADLSRWLNEEYRVPVVEEDQGDEDLEDPKEED
jgi:endogenous inhibitor of DNA gyrase (YacG/DUF329 family)